MHLVIDSNCLRDERLRAFLTAGQTHVAVLTEFVAREAFKGNALATITESMAVLADFPVQVLVLKGGENLLSVTGEADGLRDRLIDKEETRAFPGFVQDVERAKRGDRDVLKQIERRGHWANEHFELLVEESPDIRDAMAEIWGCATADERAHLRDGGVMSLRLQQRFRDVLVRMFAEVQTAGFAPKADTVSKWANTPVFRTFAAVLLMGLHRHADGGLYQRPAQKIGNDFVDMSIVACATYFDGVMSFDRNVVLMYEGTKALLRDMFNADIPIERKG
jgi:hypothetical protein